MRTIGIDIRLIGKSRTGDEAVFFHLTKEVIKLDTKSHFVLFTDENNPTDLAALAVKLGCVGNQKVTIVSLFGQNRFLWNALTLPWYLFHHRVDVYHTQYITPLLIPSRTRLLTHIHDVSFEVHPEWIGWLDRFFLRMFIPRSLRRSAAILVPSAFTRDEVARVFALPKEKIVIIPNAASESWSEPISNAARVSLRKKFQLRDVPYAIAVGTMQPRKNIVRLVEAFERLLQYHHDAQLVLVGNPSAHHVDPKVRDWEKNRPQGVIFTGYVGSEDLRALVAESQGLIIPSLYEGFGIPLLEGFLAGAPVFASDIPPFHEVANDAAFFFDPKSLESIEKALYTLFIDQRARGELLEKGQGQKNVYFWPKSAQKLLSCYEHC